jgi:hypothetical protein
MKRWYRWTTWVSLLLVVALLSGCANAANYVKDEYPLVDMAGKGKTSAKVYEAEGKTVPVVAKELAGKEKPKETSKEDPDQMFLIYDNRVVNLQKDPDNPNNTLIEIDTIEYAKQNYSSSFLEGYIAASLIQSIFGNGWYDSSKKYSTPYKGYSTSVPSKSSTSSSSSSTTDEKKPTTSDRTGSFTSKGSVPSGSSSSAAGSSGSSSSSSSSSSKSGTGSWSSSSSGSVRKNDGSSPSTKSSSKPSTSNRSGSFSSKSGGKRR